jgi:hypothetical protein
MDDKGMVLTFVPFCRRTVMIRKIALFAATAIVLASASAAGAAERAGLNAYGALTPFDTKISAQSESGQISTARSAALLECNVLAGRFQQSSWGVRQSSVYRVCMAQHGEAE